MTASTKPLPPHGTPARYRGAPRRGIKGCRCGECRTADSRYRKHLRARHRKPDIEPVRAHIRRLLVRGGSYRSIADATGCGINTIRWIADGTRTKIRASTARRVLAVASAPETQRPVPALGSIRRVQALMAAGHSVTVIRAAAGVNHNVMANLVSGAATGVWGCTAAAVAEAYDRLSMTAGSSARSRQRAERAGWPPPLAWLDIDDPDENPAGWQRRDSRRRSEDLAAEAEEIRRTCGIGWDLIAERLGVARNTLEKARERAAKRARAGWEMAA